MCLLEIYKLFYMKFKYNLIKTNKYNKDKIFNSLNNSKQAIKLIYAIVPLNVCFNFTKQNRSNSALILL